MPHTSMTSFFYRLPVFRLLFEEFAARAAQYPADYPRGDGSDLSKICIISAA